MIIKDILISDTYYSSSVTNLNENTGQVLILLTNASGTLTRTGWSSQSLSANTYIGFIEQSGNTISFNASCQIWRLRYLNTLFNDSNINAGSTLYVNPPPYMMQNRHCLFIRTNTNTASSGNLVFSFYDQTNGTYGIETKPYAFDGIAGNMQVNNYKFYIRNTSTSTNYYVLFLNYPLKIKDYTYKLPSSNSTYLKIIKEYETL